MNAGHVHRYVVGAGKSNGNARALEGRMTHNHCRDGKPARGNGQGQDIAVVRPARQKATVEDEDGHFEEPMQQHVETVNVFITKK